MGKKRRLKNREMCEYLEVYDYWFNRLSELAMSVFVWSGFPPADVEKGIIGVNTEYLERNLYQRGYMLDFKDEVLGELVLKCTAGGKLNVYDIPIMRKVFTSNGYSAMRTDKDSVLIYDNMLHKSLIPDIELFARRLTNIQMTIDINIYAQRTPIILECAQEQKVTLETAFEQYDGYKPVIKTYTGALLADGLKVLNINAPYLADKLQLELVEIWNDALTRIGIANYSNVKKERVIRDEVQRAMGGAIASRWSRLGARKKACEEMNLLYNDGYTRDVAIRDEFQNVEVDNIDSFFDTINKLEKGAENE